MTVTFLSFIVRNSLLFRGILDPDDDAASLYRRCGGGSAASVTRRRRVKSQEESGVRMRSALAFAGAVNYACAPRIIDVAD